MTCLAFGKGAYMQNKITLIKTTKLVNLKCLA